MTLDGPIPAAPHDRPVRVLQFAAVDETLQFILPLARALQAEGFDVATAARRSEYAIDPAAGGVPYHNLPITRQLRPLAILKAVKATVRLLRQRNIDILQAHTFAGGIIGRLAGWLAGTPLVVYTGHGWLHTDRTRPFARWLIVRIERLFAKLFTDYFFIISQDELQRGLADGILREGRLVTTMGVGVDCDKYDAAALAPDVREGIRAGLGIAPDEQVIGFVGRIVAEKGLIELVKAFGAIHRARPKTRLLLVGTTGSSERDGDCRRRIDEQLAADGTAAAVIFAGYRQDVREVLSACDVFTLPSYREGMPVALLEAMAMSLPCVATDISGCREEIVDGVSGYLVPPRQVEPLARRLGELLGDRDLARRIGSAARLRALEHFSLKAVLARQLEAYRYFHTLIRKGTVRGSVLPGTPGGGDA